MSAKGSRLELSKHRKVSTRLYRSSTVEVARPIARAGCGRSERLLSGRGKVMRDSQNVVRETVSVEDGSLRGQVVVDLVVGEPAARR